MSARTLRKGPMLSQADLTPTSFLEMAAEYSGNDCLNWPFSKSGGGYGKIGRDGKTLDVHRFICREVHGEPPSQKHEAAHSCGNRPCCNPNHIRWDTRKGNHSDRKRHGTLLFGERHCLAKLSAEDVAGIRALKGKLFHREIAGMFNISQAHVSRILAGRKWAHV